MSIPTRAGSDAAGVDVACDGPVLRVVLNDPPTKNALSSPKLTLVRDGLAVAEQDADIRVVVLAGAGQVFSSGWDVNAVADPDQQTGHHALTDTYTALQNCRVPVIAQVQGVAYGAAVGLIGASDLVVTDEDAVFCFPEVRRGWIAHPAVLPCLARWRLADATRYLLTGQRFDGRAAAAAGLATCAVPADRLTHTVNELAAQIAVGTPAAVEETKKMLGAWTSSGGHGSGPGRRP